MRRIPLTQGKVALVDDADYAAVSEYKWFARKTGRHLWYAVRSTWVKGKRGTQYLHRLIMSPELGLQVDHINGDALDNRRKNLRIVTNQQNSWGHQHKCPYRASCKHRGVSWNTHQKLWVAQLTKNKCHVLHKHFKLESQAIRAYKKAARRYFTINT